MPILTWTTPQPRSTFELQVRDNKDQSGNPDDVVDDTIPVQINIEGDPDRLAATFSATEPTPESTDPAVYRTATFTVTASNLPADFAAANLLGIAVGESGEHEARAIDLSGNSWTDPLNGDGHVHVDDSQEGRFRSLRVQR